MDPAAREFQASPVAPSRARGQGAALQPGEAMGLSERKPVLGEVSLERMVRAVEKVRIRLLRAATALEQAKVPYAVVGGNAVAAWVSRVDESAVRNTQDVDILLRRADLPAARQALEQAGFVYRHAAGMDMF